MAKLDNIKFPQMNIVIGIFLVFILSTVPLNSTGLNASISLTYKGRCCTNDSDLVVAGNYAFTVGFNGLEIVTISNKASPTLTKQFDPGYSYGSVFMTNPYVFATKGTAGMDIISVSSYSNPSIIKSVDFTTTAVWQDVFVEGRYAYVATGTSGLVVTDISGLPTANPFEAARYDTYGASSVFVDGSYAFVTAGNDGLVIIDVRNTASLTLEGRYNSPGDARRVYIDGYYAYVADWGVGLQIVDVRNPFLPFRVSTHLINEDVKDIFVYGPYAFLALGLDGLLVLDVSDPYQPVEVASYDDSSFITTVAVQGNYVYFGDFGLEIMQWEINPQNVTTTSTQTEISTVTTGNGGTIGQTDTTLITREEIVTRTITNSKSELSFGPYWLLGVGILVGTLYVKWSKSKKN